LKSIVFTFFILSKKTLKINMLSKKPDKLLATDPYETDNLIDHPDYDSVRTSLHQVLLAEMDRICDPFRSFRWGDRPWHRIRKAFYWGGEDRPPPAGFPFEPTAPTFNEERLYPSKV
jgi:hypothetical protein